VTAGTRVHDLQTDVSGYQLDSKGLTGKAGSTFKLTSLLTGEIALGYTKRNYDDPRLEDLIGLIGGASHLDGERAHHREAHRLIDGGRINASNCLRRALPRCGRAGRSRDPALADRQRKGQILGR
jgi:hypothetical protein